jgi:hypothetical protein
MCTHICGCVSVSLRKCVCSRFVDLIQSTYSICSFINIGVVLLMLSIGSVDVNNNIIKLRYLNNFNVYYILTDVYMYFCS